MSRTMINSEDVFDSAICLTRAEAPPHLRLYSKRHVAQLLDYSTKTVETLIKSGELKSIKLGDRSIRVSEAELEDYVDRHT